MISNVDCLKVTCSEWNAKGVSTLLVKGKKPCGEWKLKMQFIQTQEELDDDLACYGTKATGYGIVFGKVSGNLVGIDIDSQDTTIRHNVVNEYNSIVGSPPLVYYSGKGMYLIYRVDDAAGIKHNPRAAEFENGEHIEIRWNGYSVAPGSWHIETKTQYKWDFDFDGEYTLPDIPIISNANHKQLENYLASLSTTFEYTKDDVIARFNSNHTIRELLSKYGYIDCGAYFKHPNNDSVSAGSCHILDDKKCHHFGANDPMGCDRTSYPFNLYAKFEHYNDYKAAIKAASEMYMMNSKVANTPIANQEWVRPAEYNEFKKTVDGEPDREIIVDGMAKTESVNNVVGSSKSLKSWNMLDLIMSLVSGKKFMGMKVTEGDVLLIDNELHQKDLVERIELVMSFGKINKKHRLDIESYKGRITDIYKVCDWLMTCPRNTYKAVIFDALYRFYPAGFNENDNAQVTALYNLLDKVACHLNCAIFCVIHDNKGQQEGKKITDRGRGAGAMAAAAYSHITITPKYDSMRKRIENCFDIDGVCTGFKFEKFSVKWDKFIFHKISDNDICLDNVVEEKQPIDVYNEILSDTKHLTKDIIVSMIRDKWGYTVRDAETLWNKTKLEVVDGVCLVKKIKLNKDRSEYFISNPEFDKFRFPI